MLTASQKDRVESFLNQFESKVSPELKGIIQNFRKDLRDGRLFLTSVLVLIFTYQIIRTIFLNKIKLQIQLTIIVPKSNFFKGGTP